MTDPNFWKIKAVENSLTESKKRLELISSHVEQLRGIRERIEKDFHYQSVDMKTLVEEITQEKADLQRFHNHIMETIWLESRNFDSTLMKIQTQFKLFNFCYSLLIKINEILTKAELDTQLMQIELKELTGKALLLNLSQSPIAVQKKLNDIIRRYNVVIQQKKTYDNEISQVSRIYQVLLAKI